MLALAPAPHGFTVGEFAAKVHARTGTSDAEYTIRQAAYDLRKLRGKELVDKPSSRQVDARRANCERQSGGFSLMKCIGLPVGLIGLNPMLWSR